MKFPYRLQDTVIAKQKRLERDEPDEAEREIKGLEIMDLLLKSMCMEPRITDEYLDTEADDDDKECAYYLLGRFQEVEEARMNHIKKKPAYGLD